MEFAYYFHYCKNLKYEDRPDYTTLKSLFYDLLLQQINVNSFNPEFTFDWFEEKDGETRKDEEQIVTNIHNSSNMLTADASPVKLKF